VLLAAAGLLAAAPEAAPPGPLPAAWATSPAESAPAVATPPAVIASTRDSQPSLPADARLPLPDDGLSPPLPPPATVGPPGPVQRAVYVPQAEAPQGQAPPGVIQPVSAAVPAGGAPPVEVPPAPASGLSVTVSGPATAAPGQALPCQIVVRNDSALVVSGVRVELLLPPGVRLLRAEPAPQREGDRLVWVLGNLEVRARRTLALEVQTAQAGELRLCPTAQFTAAVGLRTSVVHPPFEVTLAGPEAATAGDKVVFALQVGNHSAQPLRRVGLRCELSAGLVHPQGQVIEADLTEDLAPGQVKTIQLETQASQPGRQKALVVATAEGGRSARGTAGVQVSEPSLALAIHGARKAGVGQELSVQVELTNPARQTTAPVRVSQVLPVGLEFVSASTGGTYDAARQTVTWALGELAPGGRQTVTCGLRARQPGDWALSASAGVEAVAGPAANQRLARATHAVQVEAAPSLTLDLTAGDDPVLAGRDSTYEARIYNAGPAAARGVQLVVHVPEHLLPVRAEGPTPWQVRGQQVLFQPLAEMRGRVDAVYKVTVRGVRPGQGRFRADVHAGGLARPLEQELTSRVVAPAPQVPRP
jgi:uncharacterized repeat protein (TIGR01451 family)